MLYFNYPSNLYYYYSIDFNKFYELENRQETQQDVPIHKFMSDLKSGKLTKIILKAYNDKYVIAINGGGDLVMANQDNMTPETNLTFIPQGLDREKVVIGTSKSYFISTPEIGENILSAKTAMTTPNGQFEIIPIYPDKLALKTNRGYYVLVDNTMIKGNSISIKPEGIFTIVEV
jgi:hypothetical protein